MSLRDRLFTHFTPWQLAISGLVVIILALQIGFIVVLLRARATAEDLLEQAATQVTNLADERIRYTVHISQTMPISTALHVNERIPVPVSLAISTTIPVDAEIPLKKDLLVPINLEINEVFPISTTIAYKDEILVPVDDVIHVDERFDVQVLGQDIQLPIRGDIPIQLNVKVPIDTEIPVRADIPVRFPIVEILPVNIDWMIPVDLDIPVHLPTETEVVVPLQRAIPVQIDVPLVLDVPIDIALSETPLGDYLRDLGQELRRLSGER